MKIKSMPFPSLAIYRTSFFDFQLGEDIFALSDDDWSDVVAVPVGETGVSSRLINLGPIIEEENFFQRNLCNRIMNANAVLEETVHSYIKDHGLAVEADTGLDLIEWDGKGSSTPVTASTPFAQLHALININDGDIFIDFYDLAVDVTVKSGECVVAPAQFPFSIKLASDTPGMNHFIIHKYLR